MTTTYEAQSKPRRERRSRVLPIAIAATAVAAVAAGVAIALGIGSGRLSTELTISPQAVRTSLVVLSTLLAAASAWPYLRDTIARTTQPRLVTWGTWSLLTGMAAVASASVRDYPSAAFSLIGTLATAAVVVVGWRFGDRSFGWLDLTCLVMVGGGIALWLRLDQPALAVLTACLVDFIGLIPTVVHAWRRPQEETTSTYVLIALGGVCAALAAWGDWTVTALAYPLYVAVSLGGVALLTLRRYKEQPAQPVATSPA